MVCPSLERSRFHDSANCSVLGLVSWLCVAGGSVDEYRSTTVCCMIWWICGKNRSGASLQLVRQLETSPSLFKSVRSSPHLAHRYSHYCCQPLIHTNIGLNFLDWRILRYITFVNKYIINFCTHLTNIYLYHSSINYKSKIKVMLNFFSCAKRI